MNDFKKRGEIDDMEVSAVQLAKLAGVRPEDVHYWARKGYIQHRPNGSKTPFVLSDLPRIKLMKKLIEEYSMEPSQAAPLAQRLLAISAENSEAYETALNALRLFQENLQVLANVLTKLGFNRELEKEGLMKTAMS